MARTTKSTKRNKPKAEEAAQAEEAVEQSADTLESVPVTAQDKEPDSTSENLEEETKTENLASEQKDDSAEQVTENIESEPLENEAEPLEEVEETASEQSEPSGEQVADTAPVPTSSPQKKSGFIPMFLGGVVVALLGFSAGRSDLLPENWRLAKATEVDALSSRVDGQVQDVTNLTDQVAKMAAPDMTPIESGIAGNTAAITKLQSTLDKMSTDISAVDTRLTTLEKQPISDGVSKAAIDAYERELKDLQSAVAKQRSEIESLLSEAKTLEHNAELTAQDTLARSALTRVLSAIDSGAPFGAALDDLESVGGTKPPEALSSVANSGVTPLIQLQDQFPADARAALTAARLEDPEAENGVMDFITRQLGARSVAPREGSDPDAVLSRAEAALKEGRLNDALAEIETLPAAAMPALSDWIALAKARLAAQDAAETLAQSLNSN